MIAHRSVPTGAFERPRASLARKILGNLAFGPAIFLAANIPIALAIHRAPQLAVFHSIAVLAAGVIVSSFGARRADHVAYVGAYIVGSEVLWRMAGSQIGWEFGKYALIATIGLWMIQRSRHRAPVWVALYFALLLPSAVLTFRAADNFEQARQQIAFNLTGPFAIMLSVWFFSQVQLSSPQRRNLFIAFIGSAIGIAAITLMLTVLNPDIVFTTESNKQVTGGFGPNQVSAVLGLGALISLLGSLDDRLPWGFRPMMLACVVLFSVQSAFTFSRSGVYFAGLSAAIGSLFLMRDSQSRVRAIVGGVLLAALGYYIVFPAIDDFSGGALGNRFADTDLTNREAIVEADIQIFQEHLWLGVGPGQGNYHRGAYLGEAASHTEYSRVLAEHGLFGLAALISLMAMVVQTVRQPHTMRERAIMVALFTWSFVFMLSSGTRLAAPAFMIGMACIPSVVARPQTLRLRALRAGVVARRVQVPSGTGRGARVET